MPGGAPPTTQPSLPLQRLLEPVAQQLRALGLTISFSAPSGEALLEPGRDSELCAQLRGQRPNCLPAIAALVQKVCAEGRAEVVTAPTGCCLMAVPVNQRRRLLGAAVACMPTRQMPGTEEFARTCSQGGLDKEFMTRLCARAARHSGEDGPAFCQVVEWLIQDQQAKEVAHEELNTLSTNLANTYEELSLLYRISGSIKVTQGATEFFEGLCRELLEVVQMQSAAAVLYPREHSDQAEQVVSAGQSPLSAEQLALVARRYLAPRLAGGGKTMIDNQFSHHAGHLGAKVSQIRTLVAVPLMIGEHAKGMLLGINKRQSSRSAGEGDPAAVGEFDSMDLKLISSIGGQAAVFLENHHLYEGLQDLLMGVLHALTASIDAKDPYTCGHSRRVALISRKLSELCGFDAARAGRLYLAGLLHDIGKIGMPESVLRKMGRLTDDEYNSVKCHPEVGAKILGGIRQMEDVIPAILHHHERVDGRGYPGRLSGHAIPIEALIVGMADSFDAMTSCRTYRASMPLEAVLVEVRRCAGTQFDSRLAELLLALDLEAYLGQLRQAVGGEGEAQA